MEQFVFPKTMDSRYVYIGFFPEGQLKTPVPCSQNPNDHSSSPKTCNGKTILNMSAQDKTAGLPYVKEAEVGHRKKNDPKYASIQYDQINNKQVIL